MVKVTHGCDVTFVYRLRAALGSSYSVTADPISYSSMMYLSVSYALRIKSYPAVDIGLCLCFEGAVRAIDGLDRNTGGYTRPTCINSQINCLFTLLYCQG
jgi:hypothetical protein